LIIAHRGESSDAPENTLAAINLAWERGADAVEIDIQLTKDLEIVVIHDKTTKRTADQNKRIKTHTLEELKQLKLGDSKYLNEKIPTLREVLATIPAHKKLIIEIKCAERVIPILKRELERTELKKEQIVLIGFNFKLVINAKKAMPKFKVLWLLNLDYNWFTKLFLLPRTFLISKTKKSGLDGVNVWAGEVLDDDFIRKVKKANLLIYTWTVDDPLQALNLITMGVDGITTNKAQWLKSQLLRIDK